MRPLYLDDDEYAIAAVHDAEPGSRGHRSWFWRREEAPLEARGAGKCGGLRVIYFVRYQPNQFPMLALYAKAKQENVPAHILGQLKEAFRHE